MTKRRTINPAALPAVGQPLSGGFFAGRIFFDGAEHAVIDAGREFETAAQWWEQPGPRVNVRGACRSMTAWRTPAPWPRPVVRSPGRCLE